MFAFGLDYGDQAGESDLTIPEVPATTTKLPTGDLIFNVHRLIAELSAVRPGDILFTATLASTRTIRNRCVPGATR